MENKPYNPQEPVEIILTMEQWDTVLHWLTYGGDYHRAKMHECLAVYDDKRAGAAKAAEHQKEAAEADQVRKIIESILYPQPTPETE